jgi:GH18 family chitinase
MNRRASRDLLARFLSRQAIYMKNVTLLLLALFLILSLQGCAMSLNTPPTEDGPAGTSAPTEPVPDAFRVVAYVTDAITPGIIPFDQLTHINFAFLIPNADGSFQPFLSGWKVEEVIRLAHENGVKVLISVGGWGWDQQFEAVAADPALRSLFVQNLISVVESYQFDGVDMDWEYPDAGPSAQNFLALMQELRAALPEGMLLTAAVAAVGEHGLGVPVESFELMDFINLMVYDGGGELHASMDYARASIDFWQGRGLPSEKTVLGVPFYARPTETAYWRIVKDFPEAAQLDVFDYYGTTINYNGIPTIQAKTRLALEQASGIMFWRLENDAQGDLSLLNAIHQVVTGTVP